MLFCRPTLTTSQRSASFWSTPRDEFRKERRLTVELDRVLNEIGKLITILPLLSITSVHEGGLDGRSGSLEVAILLQEGLRDGKELVSALKGCHALEWEVAELFEVFVDL